MTKRKMFLRMITASLLRRRSRMLIALLSIAIGATILSGLVTIYYDVPRQMGAQFRSYGANMILMPASDKLHSQDTEAALTQIPADQLIGATPYRYVTVQMISRQLSFVAAGTDFSQVQATSPYFMVDGAYPSGNREVLVGKETASTIGVKIGDVMEVSYTPTQHLTGDLSSLAPGMTMAGSAEGFNTGNVTVSYTLGDNLEIQDLVINADSQTPGYGQNANDPLYAQRFIGKTLPITGDSGVDVLSGATITSDAVVEAINTAIPTANAAAVTGNTLSLRITGILDTGGEEESYIFLSTQDMEALTGESDTFDVMELSVSASGEELEGYLTKISEATDKVTPRLVKRVTRSETAVLAKLQSLVFLVTAVVLLLTMICVSTTMMAVVTERRKEIGLRKALGASDNSIRVEFLGEGMFLGLLGGVLGAGLGFAFAQVVSVNVFGSSITFQPLLLPITVVVSMLISALSCLLPIRHAVRIDPALVLKGE
ncbi:MAG: FtsX-like permease family protein [Clostridia bacterium]|nr:FtsX-like permease family protein [Clostridia bacterium]MBR1684530.1 FtsX-like permease family protein [Clostridia bacterium]